MPNSKPRRRQPSDIIRAILACGLAFGLGSIGTLAKWSTGESASPGSIQAGQLDVVVNGHLANLNNLNGTYVEAAWRIEDLLPGESVSTSITVTNGGSSTMPLDLRIDDWITDPGLAPGMQIHMQTGGTPTEIVPFTNVGASTYRTAACVGGVGVDGTGLSPGTGPSDPVHLMATKNRLAVGQSVTYCLRLIMRNGGPYYSATERLAQSTTLVLAFKGTQVGAP